MVVRMVDNLQMCLLLDKKHDILYDSYPVETKLDAGGSKSPKKNIKGSVHYLVMQGWLLLLAANRFTRVSQQI